MIYFDNAATTYPKPESVYRALESQTRALGGNPSRSGHFFSQRSSDEVYLCRSELADLFGAEPENVAFTLNATYALNTAIKGIAESGDHFVISNMEHNAVFRPMVVLSEQIGCNFDVAEILGKGKTEILAELRRKIQANTKAVVMTHASNLCSFKIPIREIGELCERLGVLFVLDASQSAGHTEIDMKKDKINILCAPGHKGLYGSMGSGFIISDGKIEIKTLCEGGSGYNSADIHMPSGMPEHLEAGTLPVPALAALHAGIREISRIGFEKIERHEKRLFFQLCDRLSKISNVKVYLPENPGACLLFNIQGISSTAVDEELSKYGICIRSGFHCSPLGHKSLGTGEYGAVRASFGIYNTEKEVFDFAYAVNEIARRKNSIDTRI